MSVAQVNYIKELRDKEGPSISEIARRLNISWQTAKKYADGDMDYPVEPRRRRGCPVMDPYEKYVMAWLEEDARQWRKQQRTAQKIHKQLVSLGYTGSDRTVRGYVAKKRKQLTEHLRKRYEQFIRLEYPCGEAQVDFGEFFALDSYSNKESNVITWSCLSLTAIVDTAVYFLPKTVNACLRALHRCFRKLLVLPRLFCLII